MERILCVYLRILPQKHHLNKCVAILNILHSPLLLGLFKVIFFYFPNGESTIWGIYSEYVFFFGAPLQQIQVIVGGIIAPISRENGDFP